MTLWMIWTWILLFGAYFWMPLFKQQFILDKTMRRIYDTWRIIFGTVWNGYSMKLENWSVIKMKSQVQGLLISKMPRGCLQACCAKELIGSPTPKPTSSPTLCSACEKWEMIRLQPVRAKLSGIRKTITSRLWNESMVCRRSSSEHIPRNHNVGPPREDSKITDRSTVWSGALHSKAGSSSCQCLTTLYGRKRKQRTRWTQFPNTYGICPLLPHSSWILPSASTNPAEIYGHSWVALWLSPDPSRTHFCSTSDLAKSRHSPNPQEATGQLLWTDMRV